METFMQIDPENYIGRKIKTVKTKENNLIPKKTAYIIDRDLTYNNFLVLYEDNTSRWLNPEDFSLQDEGINIRYHEVDPSDIFAKPGFQLDKKKKEILITRFKTDDEEFNVSQFNEKIPEKDENLLKLPSGGEPYRGLSMDEKVDRLLQELDPVNEPEELVNHPNHYTFGKYEVMDVIEDWNLSYHIGNVVKYLARAGKKSGNSELQDLQKAMFFLQRKINILEKK